MRSYIFRNYWWIAFVVCIAVSALALIYGGASGIGMVGAAVAGGLGFCYFVQQQRLAETQLFHQLFTAFNERYDKLNGVLSRIAEEQMCVAELGREDRGSIVDYFNLCAEEYLFYSEGFIHREAWRSWCRGMSWYLKRHPFREIWNEEVKTESFYGLTLQAITEGAV